MFKVSHPQVSAILCLAFLSLTPLSVIAQETPQQNDSAPMLDLTQQPTAVPSTVATTAPVTPTTSPAATSRPSSRPSTQKSSSPLQPTPAKTSPIATATPTAAATAPNLLPNTIIAPSPENVENTENTGGSADIPPDPNVLDSAMNAPIYTQPIAKAPIPLDENSEFPKEKSPYTALIIVLSLCLLAAAVATGYFLYIRFNDND